MRLDRKCRLEIGTRDAVHVPIVVGKLKYGTGNDFDIGFLSSLVPGAFVKFIDSEYEQFVMCDKAAAHGIVNPFLEEVAYYAPVVVFLFPGITTPVRHHFDIDPKLRVLEQSMLEAELAEAKADDPECAGCWSIRNNEVQRD